MAADESSRIAVSATSQQLSRPLRRLLRRYAARVETVRDAESTYRDVVLTESLRHNGKMRRASTRRIDAAFGTLVDAVIDLQSSQVEALSSAADEGLPPEAVGALDQAFDSADREYAGYLAARTYEQVRVAATNGPVRPH
jgi:hypothetical protein